MNKLNKNKKRDSNKNSNSHRRMLIIVGLIKVDLFKLNLGS